MWLLRFNHNYAHIDHVPAVCYIPEQASKASKMSQTLDRFLKKVARPAEANPRSRYINYDYLSELCSALTLTTFVHTLTVVLAIQTLKPHHLLKLPLLIFHSSCRIQTVTPVILPPILSLHHQSNHVFSRSLSLRYQLSILM